MVHFARGIPGLGEHILIRSVASSNHMYINYIKSLHYLIECKDITGKASQIFQNHHGIVAEGTDFGG